jgi:hypothetical protein
MILAFVTAVILFALLLLIKKKPARRYWYMLFSLGLLFSLLVSFVSVWAVWSMYASTGPLYGVRDSGLSGWSGLSYPMQLSVYFGEQTVQNFTVVGNVSFVVSIANQKVLETNGTLSYDSRTVLMGRPAPISYQLQPPFYSNTEYFLGFLLLLFFLFDMAGFALGLILTYAVSKKLSTRTQAAAKQQVA